MSGYGKTPPSPNGAIAKPKGSNSTLSMGAAAPATPVADEVPAKPRNHMVPSKSAPKTPTGLGATDHRMKSMDAGSGGGTSTTKASDAVDQVQPPQDGAKRLSDMVAEIINKDGNLMRYARQRGQESAAAKGLGNSNIATGTAEQVAMEQAVELGTTAFNAEQAQLQHEQTLAAQTALTDAQIQNIMADIATKIGVSGGTGGGAGGGAMVSNEYRQHLNDRAQNIFDRYTTRLANNMTTYKGDGASLAAANRQAYNDSYGQLKFLFRDTGVSDEDIRGYLDSMISYGPPVGRNWSHGGADLANQWINQGYDLDYIRKAAQWAMDQNMISQIKYDEILDRAHQRFGTERPASRPDEMPTI